MMHHLLAQVESSLRYLIFNFLKIAEFFHHRLSVALIEYWIHLLTIFLYDSLSNLFLTLPIVSASCALVFIVAQ